MLEQKQDLYSDVTGESSVVLDDDPVGQGGFGIVWRGEASDGRLVALKMCNDRTTWAGEAYFGSLGTDLPRFIGVHDTVIELQSGRRLLYVLVSDWVDGGTVEDQLRGSPLLAEKTLVRELKGLLGDLAQVHRVGITHRDIKPANAFLRRGRLLLGDFGISKQALGRSAPAYYGTEAYSPPEHRRSGRNWEPRDDVYMLGLLALSMLLGSPATTDDIEGRLDVHLRQLDVSDDLKYWFWPALGPREFRFHDAGEALRGLREGTPELAPPPDSLRDQGVVFTGRLPGVSRADAT